MRGVLGRVRRGLAVIGSPTTITILVIVLVIGMTLALTALSRGAAERQATAGSAAAFADAAVLEIELLTHLYTEQSIATQLSVGRHGVDEAKLEDAIVGTDAALDAFVELIESPRLQFRLDDAATGSLNEVGEAMAALPQVRDAIALRDGVSPFVLYGALVAPINAGIADQAYLGGDADQVRLRRAVGSLLSAAEAVATRRALGTAILSSPADPAREEAVQLLILDRDATANIEQAIRRLSPADPGPALATAPLRKRTVALVEQLSTSDNAEVVRELSDRLLLPEHDGLTIDEWIPAATTQLSDVLAAAGAVQVEVRAAANREARTARQSRAEVRIVFLVLLGLALLAGGASIVTAHEHVGALAEHRELVDGMLSWFHVDPVPFPGLQAYARYLAAPVHAGAGGDWYDVFSHGSDDVAVIAMGDVAGHTTRAVARVAEVRNTLRGLESATTLGPAAVLSALDRTLEPGPLTTVVLAHVDTAAGTCTFSRAGHVPLIVRRADGTTEVELGASDLPLGVDESVARSETTIAFGEGDIALLFTDGLIEQPQTGLDESIEQLRAALESADVEDLPSLSAELLAASPTAGRDDDCSLLLLRPAVTIVAQPAPGALPASS